MCLVVNKSIVIVLFLSIHLWANIYEENCVQCHNKIPVSIDKYFYKYLLVYSSEGDMKHAIVNYLKVPFKETTVMSDAFISRFGVKKKSELSEKELTKAVNIYWEKYKVFGKLK